MGHQPDQGPEQERTARAHEAAGRLAEAAAGWGVLAAARPFGTDRADALAHQARLLGSSPQAIGVLRRALANDPSHLAAIEALAERAREAANWLLLANLQRLRFAQEAHARTRAEVALRAGRLELERLRSPGAARDWFHEGLECDPDHRELLQALVDLERTRGDEGALLVSLERLIELRGDAAPVSALLEAAALRVARGEPARALGHLEQATARAPDDPFVLEALADVLGSLDRLPELADVLERRAALAADDPALRAGVLTELGALLEERMFDPEAALEAFERACAADPGASRSAEAVARLRAKRTPGGAAPDGSAATVERAAAGASAANAPTPRPETAPSTSPGDDAIARLEREARAATDRSRLAQLVREIESLHRQRGSPERALPWVQRWALSSPEDPEALRALARIHGRPGRETELSATLEALDPLLDLEEQAANRRSLAALYQARGRTDDAVRACERALSLEPRDLETLERLQSLHRDRGDRRALVPVLRRMLELREPRLRPAALLEIAQLQEESGDLAGAIATRVELEEAGEVTVEVEEQLDTLLERAGRHAEIEARLRRRGDRFDDGSAERVAIELRRAQILLSALERPEEAAEAFRAVLLHAPESPEAKSGLERSLRQSIDASALADFLAEQAQASADPVARERAAFERAVLLEEELDRIPEAREAYRALARDASDPDLREDASHRYDRLLQRSGEWHTLRQHLEAALGSGDPVRDAALHERLARLCSEQLHDDAGELRNLERVVELDASRVDVWRTLADRYEREGRSDDQIRALERELAAGADAARRLTLHARLAELTLYARRDSAAAREHYERVFELDPSHAAAAHFLIERYDQDRRPEDVIRVLEARLATSGAEGDGDAARLHRAALRIHLANVRAVQQDDVEGAISDLEVALGEVGPTPQVAEPLAACYQRAGYPLDLIELARNAAGACTEPAESANWYVRMGDAYLSLEKPREAADAYRQALSERPDDRAVQASLRAIYRQLGQTAPLAGLLDAELSHLAGPAEVPVRMELARLQAGPLARPQDALLHVKRVLQLVPRHAEAFALALDLAGAAGRHEVALELLDAQIEQAASAHERALLLGRRSELLAGPLGRPEEAIEALRASLAVGPDADRRQRLAELLEQCARTAEWLEVIGEQARDASGERRSALLERAARVAWDRLSPDAALPWLERLAALREGDVDVRLRIAQAHRAAGRTESLLRALSDALARTRNPVQRRDLELERAALLEIELSAPARALAALEDALAANPADAEVLGRIERLQGALGRHPDRTTTLEALLAVSPEDALELHGELARLWDGPLHDPARAALHWRAALSLAPGGGRVRTEILRSLAATWRRAGELERWAEAAEEELAALDPRPVFDDRRRELHRELALGYHLELARPGPALRHARALLDAGGDDIPGGGTLDRIEAIALELLRQADAPVELEARLTRHLARRPADAELWLELARLRDERLQVTGAAIDAYRRVLELDATCLPALRGLRSCAERLFRDRDVAEALERELDHPDTTSPELRSGLLRRLGDLYWHRLQSTTRASRCYAAALEVNGADFAALRSLERLLEAMEDWRGAIDLYESEVEVLADADPQRRREIWIHVAELARDRTGDVERARRALRRAARISPLPPPRLRELAELHARAGDEAAFAETFAAWCDDPGVTPAPEDELRLGVCLERLSRAQDALRHVMRATAGQPATPDAWDAEARLREALGDEIGAADALCAAADRAPDREAAARLLRAARLAEPRDAARALELLRRAVGRDPGDTGAQAYRARIALESGALLEAEEAAAAALDLGTAGLGQAERLAIAMNGGDAARAGGRLEAAAGFYAQAYACDPRDARATGAYGETLAALGDTTRARQALEARLAAGDAYPERAAHRATLAACLEAEQAPEQSLDAALAALADDPRHEGALGICVRAHESLGHVDEAVEATLRWAAAAPTPAVRAQRLLRAAEWEIRSGEREASAEAHLREAIASDAALTTAWIVLISLLIGQGRFEEAVDCANRAATHAPSDADLGLLALLQGRACEQSGDRAAAAEAFGVALEAEPRCSESALARARLLRGAGDWRAAAEALQGFLARHPEPDHADLGPVHEQLGRLLAGPLEDVEAAVRHYRRAIELSPDPLAARAALAELLSHREGDRHEALSHLRVVLDAHPTDVASLRVALRLARANPAGAGVATGIEVLRALGAASAYERDEAPGTPVLAQARELGDPRFELLRGVASLAAEAIAQALQASEAAAAPVAEGPEAAFRAALLRREGLLAAPALVPLPTREVASVLELVVRLASDGDAVRGDGRLVNALSAALGRRLRRRLRKHLGDASIDALCAVDFDAFRVELRALAAGLAIADTGCGLRTALACLARDEDDTLDAELREAANLAPRVAAAPAARALLRRLIGAWLERI